jgi:recombination protein RecT
MPARGSGLARRVEEAQAVEVGGGDRRNIAEMFRAMGPELARILPQAVSLDALLRTALTTVRRSPELQRCSSESLLGALMLCGQVGLMPGPLGHVYLTPRKGEVVWILGYRGMVHLALRSPAVRDLNADVVYRADRFSLRRGTTNEVVHDADLDDPHDPATIRGAWLVANLSTPGGEVIDWINRHDVERRRALSAAPNSPAWKNNYDAMTRKSVIRKAAPMLPLSPEAQYALAHDERVAPHRDAVQPVADFEPDSWMDERDEPPGGGGDDPGAADEVTEPSSAAPDPDDWPDTAQPPDK